jgi:hypothetical protein
VVAALPPQIQLAEGPLRVAFLGHADKVKGPDTLRAVLATPELHIKLHLYGVIQGSVDQDYWSALRRLAAGDKRITLFPAVPNDVVVSLLRD